MNQWFRHRNIPVSRHSTGSIFNNLALLQHISQQSLRKLVSYPNSHLTGRRKDEAFSSLLGGLSLDMIIKVENHANLVFLH